MEQDEQGGDPTAERVEKMTIDTPVDKLTEFQKGARAMFDALNYRASNHWHPHHMEQCNYDNKLIYEWAEDALEEVDEFSGVEWKSINQMFADGVALGKAQAEAKKQTDRVDNEIKELNIAAYISIVAMAFAILISVGAYRIGANNMAIFATLFVAAMFVCSIIVLLLAWRAKQNARFGSYPPAPMPPAPAPAPSSWNPKM